MGGNPVLYTKKKVVSGNNNKLLLKRIIEYKYFYIMLIPAVVFYFIFSYVPLYGIIIAFREFSFRHIFGGEWVGLKYFREILTDRMITHVILNTLIINFGRLIFVFPIPIILALLLNEVSKSKLKRYCQTVFTFPHFISWVVAAGIITNLLNNAGVINQIITSLGGKSVDFLINPNLFRVLIFASDGWKEAGWSSIIYLATIAGINPELSEAAIVDGAKRHQVVKYIILPALRSVIGILFILSLANIMNTGFDQIMNLHNSAVYEISDTIDTYIYRRTFTLGASFSSSTAFGVMKSAFSLILIIAGNNAVKKINGQGMV